MQLLPFLHLFLTAQTRRSSVTFLGTTSSSSSIDEEVRSMRVKEIQAELKLRQISTVGIFEKDELVIKLVEARKAQPELPDDNVISTKLFLTSLDENQRLQAANANGILTTENQTYPAIEITVQNQPMRLLVDTACSGLVLSPSTQNRFNLPSYSNPVTMTSAAGTGAATGLTTLQEFKVQGQSFGPLPAAVQDISMLPAFLDGILGLSFMNQFVCVEFDFKQSNLVLYKSDPPPKDTVLSEGKLQMLGSLGILTTDVYFDSNGPVSMLVDTGASNTLLNWKGVQDLGLDKSQLSKIPTPFGAMGSDNAVLELTHRLYTKNMQMSKPGLSLAPLAIDVGNIPIIDNLPGVGGILGIDVLMQSDALRVFCRREPRTITVH